MKVEIMFRMLRFLPVVLPIAVKVLRSPRVKAVVGKWAASGTPTGKRSRPGTRTRRTGR